MSVGCLSNVGMSKTPTINLTTLTRSNPKLAKGAPVMKTGSFGAKIHYIHSTDDGSQGMAVKKYCVDRANDENGEDLVKFIWHEVSTMNMLKHPNILQCLASIVVDQEVWLITPLMKYGSVSNLLATGFCDGLPEMICCFILRDILLALQYLHQQGVVHRSVRSSHILISAAGGALLSGFRYSTSLHATGEHRSNLYDYPLHSINSNLFWLAPEVLKQNLLGYTETSDIYSLGVASCEMANGLVPYSDFPSTLMLIEKLRGSSPRLLDFSTLSAAQQLENEGGAENAPPHPPPHPTTLADSGVGESVGSCNNMLGKNSTFYNREFSGQFHDFVAECTISCGEQRQSATQLLQHSWIKQLRKTNVTLLTLLHSVKPVTNFSSSQDIIQDENCGLMVEQMQGLKMAQEDNINWDFD